MGLFLKQGSNIDPPKTKNDSIVTTNPEDIKQTMALLDKEVKKLEKNCKKDELKDFAIESEKYQDTRNKELKPVEEKEYKSNHYVHKLK